MLGVTLDRSARFGWLAGPLVVLGHGTLELLLVIGLVFGLGKVLAADLFTGVIGVVGGLVLVWFGIGIIQNSGKVNLPDGASARAAEVTRGSALRWWNPAVSGATTSISNPYWLLWWGTVGAGYVAMAVQRYGAVGLTAFYAGHVLSDLVWFTLMAAMMAAGGQRLPRRLFVNLLRVLGVFLVVTAGYFVWNGLNLLL